MGAGQGHRLLILMRQVSAKQAARQEGVIVDDCLWKIYRLICAMLFQPANKMPLVACYRRHGVGSRVEQVALKVGLVRITRPRCFL